MLAEYILLVFLLCPKCCEHTHTPFNFTPPFGQTAQKWKIAKFREKNSVKSILTEVQYQIRKLYPLTGSFNHPLPPGHFKVLLSKPIPQSCFHPHLRHLGGEEEDFHLPDVVPTGIGITIARSEVGEHHN